MMLKLELKESIGGKHAKQTLDCFRHGRHSIAGLARLCVWEAGITDQTFWSSSRDQKGFGL